MKVFPTCLFAPNGTEADIERRTISGGVALNGDETIIATDGGGRVFLEMSDFYLDDVPVALAWSAISAWMDGGVRPIIVPFCDARHQPIYDLDGVTHSDGTTFSDETEYESSSCDAELSEDAALRATTIHIAMSAMGRALLGGEWLSIDHPVMRWRAYRIAEIISQDEESAILSIRPPLREAVTAGTPIDFDDPRCVMRLSGDMRAPRSIGYAEGSALRFVEDFTGSYA